MNNTERKELIEKYRMATSKLVLLDYDGTLVDYETIPDNAKLPEHLANILINLINKPQTTVFIISGRSQYDLDKFLDHITVNIIAEHGAMIKENGTWKNQVIDNSLWKNSVLPFFNRAASDCPESFVEEKNYSLAWHYRNADSQLAFAHSRELIRILGESAQTYNLKILDGNKVVEILTNETGKGKAVKELSQQKNYDFILSIGDDVTDEEMFEYFRHDPHAFTIKVGNGVTSAHYKLNTIDDVVSLLKHLSA